MSSRSASVLWSRCGASYNTVVRVSIATISRRSLRSTPERGKKPSKTNRPAGKPLSVTAMIAAEGPGVALTTPPASTTARTMRSPGSLMPGLPASVMSATIFPSATKATIFSRESCSVCSLTTSSGLSLTPMCCSNLLECRVSSQQITSASRSASTARAVMSDRLPIGVATSTSLPVMRAAVLMVRRSRDALPACGQAAGPSVRTIRPWPPPRSVLLALAAAIASGPAAASSPLASGH